jgi:hypothetical protein
MQGGKFFHAWHCLCQLVCAICGVVCVSLFVLFMLQYVLAYLCCLHQPLFMARFYAVKMTLQIDETACRGKGK